MSTQMLKVTTETEINDVRRQVGRIFHVNATVFNPNWHEAGLIYPPYNFWIGFCQLNFLSKISEHF